MSDFTLALLNLGLRPQPDQARGRVIAARDRDEPMTAVERGAASRQWVLEILRLGGRLSVNDLSDKTSLSRQTIAHHLRMLELVGLSEVVPVHGAGNGRPRLLWQAASGESATREAA